MIRIGSARALCQEARFEIGLEGEVQKTFDWMDPSLLRDIADASLVEAVPLVLLTASIVAVGVYPSFLTDLFQIGLDPMVAVLNGGG